MDAKVNQSSRYEIHHRKLFCGEQGEATVLALYWEASLGFELPKGENHGGLVEYPIVKTLLNDIINKT